MTDDKHTVAQSLQPTTSPQTDAPDRPNRGQEMIQNLRQKLRAPPLEHTWVFWHDRPKPETKDPAGDANTAAYADGLTELHTIADVRDFWEVYNNFEVANLAMRDSVHLFHKGIKPIWEDERNLRGGSWTFRVPKDQAEQLWKEISMLAIGGALQEAIASQRTAFLDDICGVSYSVRFRACNISVWNRDADHKEGVEKVLQTVLDKIAPNLRPKEGSYYYKPHFEHRDFQNTTTTVQAKTALDPLSKTPAQDR